jgi:hypothetical protein
VRDQERSSRLLITAVFWEAFSAGSAVTALLHLGFADADIDAVGVLSGAAPDLSGFFASVGVPHVDAAYYNDCFQDGAVLVIIRARPGEQHRAIEVLRYCGGVLPPSYETPVLQSSN